MTAASLGPGPSLFTFLSENRSHSRRGETFFFSLLGQAVILAIVVYFTTLVIRTPGIESHLPRVHELPLIFSGLNGGGGGNFDPLPASRGNPPRASLDPQIVPPTVIVPKEMPRLPVEPTVIVAPEIKFPQGGPSRRSHIAIHQSLRRPGRSRRDGERLLRRNRRFFRPTCGFRSAGNLSCREDGCDRA